MILRRLSSRIGARDWFAVGLDFVIVVAGILMALQIGTWDDQRRSKELERAYLTRLATEIRANIVGFSEDRQVAVDRSERMAEFGKALRDSSTPDAELIGSARGFFGGAWQMPAFAPSVTTFTDLSSTGNLQVIRNADLREAVIELYEVYRASSRAVEINTSWVLPNDARLSYEYDVLQWDATTTGFFPDRSDAQAARELRAHNDAVLRQAAAYYWIYQSALGSYDEATARSQSVLDGIEAELSGR